MGTVDWTKPIEAVHTCGTAISATRPVKGETDLRYVRWENEHSIFSAICYENGKLHAAYGQSWSIRNVEPTLRTSDEALRRMEALVERMATATPWDGKALLDEARAIQALRSPPIDPRIALVVTALVQNGIGKPVAPLFARDVLKALDAENGK